MKNSIIYLIGKYPIKVNNFDIGTDENGELNVKIKVNDLTPEVQNLLSQV